MIKQDHDDLENMIKKLETYVTLSDRHTEKINSELRNIKAQISRDDSDLFLLKRKALKLIDKRKHLEEVIECQKRQLLILYQAKQSNNFAKNAREIIIKNGSQYPPRSKESLSTTDSQDLQEKIEGTVEMCEDFNILSSAQLKTPTDMDDDELLHLFEQKEQKQPVLYSINYRDEVTSLGNHKSSPTASSSCPLRSGVQTQSTIKNFLKISTPQTRGGIFMKESDQSIFGNPKNWR